jgi:polyphosphate kinase
MGICSSNLDEFYRVRVATLNRLVDFGKKAKKLIGGDPEKILSQITEIALVQHSKFDKIFKQISSELAKENIYIINEKELTDTQGEFVLSYFHNEVRSRLFPLMIDQVNQIPELRDRTIYLAVLLGKSDGSQKSKHALIEVRSDVLSRFLILPAIERKNYIILLDDVIRYGLSEIFYTLPYDTFSAYTIKMTRDAELDIVDDVSESYIEKVSKSLKQRKEGNPVRFTYDAEIPQDFLDLLMKHLNLTQSDTLIAGSRYHNNSDFMNFPKIGGRHLRYPPIKVLAHKDIDEKESLLRAIRDKDILLHYPYQNFDYIIDLLREASIDPKVTSIKTTIYRVAKYSSIMNALINAVKNGKSVVAVLELQARFDEETNIYWANRLQEEGVKVIFGIPGLKVHSKLCLITRKEKGKFFHSAIIGTGNFNEDTARIYSDHSLLTFDKRLTSEVIKVFELFENAYKVCTFKHLIVSPNYMRKAMLKLIKREIINAQNGQEAYITLKLNNLVDSQLIQKLYEASEAGVKIKLMVRGMFSLIPGIPGMSSNIEATGTVDKYLEHTRIFVFCNAGDEKYFISSADWMPRNIDRRIEVTCPIYDDTIKEELRKFIDIHWRDNVKARILNQKLDNKRRTTDEKSCRAQWHIYDYLKKQLPQD